MSVDRSASSACFLETIGSQVDAREHHFTDARALERLYFSNDLIEWARECLSPRNMNDAIGARMIAAILHLHATRVGNSSPARMAAKAGDVLAWEPSTSAIAPFGTTSTRGSISV